MTETSMQARIKHIALEHIHGGVSGKGWYKKGATGRDVQSLVMQTVGSAYYKGPSAQGGGRHEWERHDFPNPVGTIAGKRGRKPTTALRVVTEPHGGSATQHNIVTAFPIRAKKPT